MTANKPEVVAYHHSNKTNPDIRGVSLFHDPNRISKYEITEPLIRLSDYEALQAECEKLRKDAERYRSMLSAVLREIPHGRAEGGNAPGHAHAVPGIWDEDNGALAGKECAWCKVWNEAISAMQEDQ